MPQLVSSPIGLGFLGEVILFDLHFWGGSQKACQRQGGYRDEHKPFSAYMVKRNWICFPDFKTTQTQSASCHDWLILISTMGVVAHFGQPHVFWKQRNFHTWAASAALFFLNTRMLFSFHADLQWSPLELQWLQAPPGSAPARPWPSWPWLQSRSTMRPGELLLFAVFEKKHPHATCTVLLFGDNELHWASWD